MTGTVASRSAAPPSPLPSFDGLALLNALNDAVLLIDGTGALLYANLAAEQFFQASASYLLHQRLGDLLPADSPLFSLIDQVMSQSSVVSEYGVTLETPRIGTHFVNLQVAPVTEHPGTALISIHEQSIARQIDRQLTHRNAARSVTAMAALLAHEVKNPLSGIRGAAQLLEQSVPTEDRTLTQLICDETDRICGLVDRMEVFADKRPLTRDAVNIHQVLEHVHRIARSGFARHVRFRENYDPSLPPVYGNRDQLIQVFLNLVKNAAEAAPEHDAEIVLSTSYRHGVRLAIPGSDSRVALPLVVSVQDNGEGIPEDIRPHLFDAFVTTKPTGSGLGLALVAKIIGDHGGIIEFDSEPRRTVFRVMLPTVDTTGEHS